MVNARDDRWLSIAEIKNELAERSTLRDADIGDLLKSAVTGGHVAIRFADSAEGQEARWADIKDRRYSDSALRRQRQDAANAAPRYSPFDRRREGGPRQLAPRAASPTGYDQFCSDPDVRLNLRKVMAFIESNHGTEFEPAAEDALDLDAPTPTRPGRREDEIWDDVKDDLLLWLDRNHDPRAPWVKNRLVNWVLNWFLEQGYEEPGQRVGKGNKKAPSESTIKLKVDEVLARHERSLKRQKLFPRVFDAAS